MNELIGIVVSWLQSADLRIVAVGAIAGICVAFYKDRK